MLLHRVITKGTAGFMTMAMAFSLIPQSVRAEEGSMDTSASVRAEERVVTNSNDTPLERQALLQRAWIVYREMGSKQIWAIGSNTVKHEIKTLDFFTAFNANYHIQLVASGRLSNLQTGEPITSVDGLNPEDYRKSPWRCRLVKVTDKPAVYLVCNGKRRVVVREGVFHRFGWEFRDVEAISQSELDTFTDDSALDESTVFDEEVEVETTHNRKLRESLSKRLELRNRLSVRSRLVKAVGDSKIYLIDAQGRKRHIDNLEVSRKFSLNLTETTEVSADEIAAFPEGPAITFATANAELNATVSSSVSI